MTFLSSHFNLEEFTQSQTAARLGLDNTPSEAIIARLRHTATGLEAVRMLLGAPITISSGYRSPIVNKAVGGATNSQHLTGEAADFICPSFGDPADIVRAIVQRGLDFDQCIVEFGQWVHISFSATNRKQALVIDHDGTRAFA